MAGLDLGVGDAAVGLNRNKQHDFTAYVHAVSEFGIDGWDAGDDSSMDVCRRGLRRAEGETACEEKRTRGAKWDCQVKPP